MEIIDRIWGYIKGNPRLLFYLAIGIICFGYLIPGALYVIVGLAVAIFVIVQAVKKYHGDDSDE